MTISAMQLQAVASRFAPSADAIEVNDVGKLWTCVLRRDVSRAALFTVEKAATPEWLEAAAKSVGTSFETGPPKTRKTG